MKSACIWLVLALLLGACGARDDRCVALAPGAAYCLQPTATVAPFDVQQKVELAFNGGKETMIAEVEVDAGALRFVGLTPFGQKLIETSYENGRLAAAGLASERVPPALLLALVQLARWPLSSLREGLGAGLSVEETAGQRRFSVAGEPVLTIIRDGAQIQYHRTRFEIPAYRLVIDVEDLSPVAE